MRPSESLARHRDEVLAVIARYPVANPCLYGSVARGDDAEGSDIDILVEDRAPISTFELADLELELEALLNARVDVRLKGDLSKDVTGRVASDIRPL